MRTTTILSTGLALLVCVAACDEGTTEPLPGGLTPDDLAFVALDGDAVTGALVFTETFGPAGAGASAAAAERETREFSRSRPCAAGGTIELDGTVDRERHGDGTVEATITGTRQQVDCARTREDVTIVINGSGSFEAYRKRVDGEPVGNQTTSYAGSFEWVRTRGEETRSGTCEYSLESVRQPDAMKVRVTGTMCGREVDREREWGHGT
jgi:hypothetical protein